MENGREYLSILTESLKKKITILDEILLLNQKQLESVSGNEIDDDLFNEIIAVSYTHLTLPTIA